MKRALLLLSISTGTYLYSMNPHESCGLFFDFAPTHLVPEPVARQLFPTSAPDQFIFLAHALQYNVLPENQHLAMRIFLEKNKLFHNHALKNPATIQQAIDNYRRLICALAAVFSVREYPAAIPVKPLILLFSDRARRHTLYYKIAHKSGLDDEQIDMLKFEVQQAYDAQDATQL